MIWFHVSSVGEFNAILPLLEEFRKHGYDVLLSVYTLAGYKYARKRLKDVPIFKYSYFDNPVFVRNLLERFPIKALIISETELWYNLITIPKKHGIKVFIVNGRISDRSFRMYRIFDFFFSKLIERIDRIYARSDRDRIRFKLLGAKNVVFLGDLKVDAVMKRIEPVSRKEILLEEDDLVLTFGSVRGKEFPHVLRVMKALRKRNIKFILAPRHLHHVDEWKYKLESKGFKVSLRTHLKQAWDVLILDTIGELVSFYALSDICFVGGTLERYGGHNVLEPLYLGKPVIVGRFYSNVKEHVRYFKKRRAIFVVEDVEEFVNTVNFLTSASGVNEYIAKVCKEFFSKFGNAKERIFKDLILNLS